MRKARPRQQVTGDCVPACRPADPSRSLLEPVGPDSPQEGTLWLQEENRLWAPGWTWARRKGSGGSGMRGGHGTGEKT